MDDIIITNKSVKTLYNTRFLNMFDIQYKEGKHYFEATRRELDDVVALKSESERKNLIPDAVTVGIVLHLKDEEPKLLMTYEYRYAVSEFLLSPVAGLIDPEDKNSGNALVTASIREIKEESGLEFNEKTDSIYVVNPCAFSSPGMTDESNAFVWADIYIEDLGVLNHEGAVGSEIFDGFELLDMASAKVAYKEGRDKNGHFFSLATWAVLGYFINNYQN